MLRTPPPLPVLVFLGVAGSGKSSLLGRAREIATREGHLTAAVSFEGGQPQAPMDVFRSLRDQLNSADKRLFFPRFDVLYGLLVRATSPTNAVPAELVSLANLIGLMEAMPFLGQVVTFANATYRYSNVTRRWLAEQRVKEWFSEKLPGSTTTGWKDRLRSATGEQLSRLIPDAFAADLSGGLPVSRPRPAVLVFDDFETLLSEGGPIGATFVEEFARAIRVRKVAVLVLIGTRDELRWGRVRSADGTWTPSSTWNEANLRQIELSQLSDAEATDYLRLRGLAPEPIAALVRVTKGHPLGLAAVADVLGEDDGSGPSGLDLSALRAAQARWTPLTDEWVRELNAWVLEALVGQLRRRGEDRLLSLLPLAATARWFDEDVLVRAGDNVTQLEFDTLTAYSFVRAEETVAGRIYRLHDVFRALIRSDRSLERLRRRNAVLRDAFLQRAAHGKPPARVRLLIEAMYHAWRVDVDEACALFDRLSADADLDASLKWELVRTADDEVELNARARVLLGIASSALHQVTFTHRDAVQRHESAISSAMEAVRAAGDDAGLAGKAHLAHAEALVHAQRFGAGVESARRARAAAESCGDQRTHARALAYLAAISAENPDYGDPALLDQALAVDPQFASRDLARAKATLAKQSGQLDALAALVDELEEAIVNELDPYVKAGGGQFLGECLATLGRWQEALDLFERAGRAFHQLAEDRGACAADGWRGAALCALGQEPEGMELLLASLRIERDLLSSREGASKWLELIGAHRLRSGRIEDSLAPLWLARDLRDELSHATIGAVERLLDTARQQLGDGRYGELAEAFDPRTAELAEFAFLWGFGRFKRMGDGPILAPRASTWEDYAVFNPAAVRSRSGIELVYRAQGERLFDAVHVSRLGHAFSADGVHFNRAAKPIFEPREPYELPAGCEDPRIVEIDGRYVMTYTAYDGRAARLALATSNDLVTWDRRGLVFPRLDWSKSGAIVPQRIGGLYWMYFGDTDVWAARSPDLQTWEAVADPVLRPRPGRFDSKIVEPGPPPVVTPDGVLLIYNGADESLRYSAGQALFDVSDPTRVVRRSPRPILEPELPEEREGNVPNVVFAEGLVRWGTRWLLYYGMADTRVGVAATDA